MCKFFFSLSSSKKKVWKAMKMNLYRNHTNNCVLYSFLSVFFNFDLIKWLFVCDWISALYSDLHDWFIIARGGLLYLHVRVHSHSAVILLCLKYVYQRTHFIACTSTYTQHIHTLKQTYMLFLLFDFKHKTMSMIYKSYDVCRLNDCR